LRVGRDQVAVQPPDAHRGLNSNGAALRLLCHCEKARHAHDDRLRSLTLAGTKITNAGLANVRDLTQLSTLNLGNTPISDLGLRHLERLKNLFELDLGRTGITDAGIERLKGLKSLYRLRIEQTKVTPTGVKDLQQVLGLTLFGRWVYDSLAETRSNGIGLFVRPARSLFEGRGSIWRCRAGFIAGSRAG
jgi:hypothetical protein